MTADYRVIGGITSILLISIALIIGTSYLSFETIVKTYADKYIFEGG